jgi:hypothetical protein
MYGIRLGGGSDAAWENCHLCGTYERLRVRDSTYDGGEDEVNEWADFTREDRLLRRVLIAAGRETAGRSASLSPPGCMTSRG